MPSSKWTPELEVKLLLAVLKAASVKISQVDLDKVQAAVGSDFTFEGIRYVVFVSVRPKLTTL